jgi:2-dehydropantoate 2-reductase
MTQFEKWPRIAVVGAGAVGGYFGGMLARAGADVTMIGRQQFADAVNTNGLFLDTLQFQESVRVKAVTEIGAVSGADIVLFCVKTTDNAATARSLVPVLAPDAIVVSMQNGVDNVEQIREAANLEVVPAVVYVAAFVPEPGKVKHGGRGDLSTGPRSDKTERLAETFSRAGVTCRITENIVGEMWTKLAWNCALNAISALGRVTYGKIGTNGDARKVVKSLVEEILAVAKAANIELPGYSDLDAAMAGALRIAEQLPSAYSSTAQDLIRGKRTEIDSLNGYISRRGAELGVPTPVNHALYTLVRFAETSGS